MKAYRLVGITVLSLFLFSCASKPSVDDINIEEAENLAAEIIESPEAEEILDELEASKNDSDFEATAESNPEAETSEIADILEENNFIETDILHQELEEIIEPEVIELEPPAEEIIVEEEPEIESEIIPDVEKEIQELPPVEIKLEDTKEQTSTDENKSLAESDVVVTVAKEELQSVEEEVVQVEDEVAVVVEDSDEVECLDGDDTSSTEQKADEVIIPSRSIKIKLMEYVDVVYPGKGWIFMGATDNSKDLTYNGRQIGTENTKFSLQAKVAGTKILHFYKNDAVKGDFIDDYVEVIVSKEKGSPKTHIAAPEYKTPLPMTKNPIVKAAQEEKSETAEKEETVTEKKIEAVATPKTEPKSEPKTVTTTTPAKTSTPKTESKLEQKVETKVEAPVKTETPKIETPIIPEEPVETIDIDKLFTEAKQAYDAKNYSVAANKFNQFLEHSTSNRDEALYLLGQIYEAPGQSQNIQGAINSYTTLINNYPASKYWDNANKRIIYLKRFYMEGR